MNDCPTSPRSAIVPGMSTESAPSHTTSHGHCEHSEHSRDSVALDDAEAWAAVLRRDRSFDGRFVTGVLTTGIYCRPSCAARHPARSNVRFFAEGAEARAAGLRACLRCLPDDIARDEQAVLRAIKAIKAAEAPLPLAQDRKSVV